MEVGTHVQPQRPEEGPVTARTYHGVGFLFSSTLVGHATLVVANVPTCNPHSQLAWQQVSIVVGIWD